MATETNSEGEAPFKASGFSTSRIMKQALDVLPTFEAKGRFAQALFGFGFDGEEPTFLAEGEPAATSFELVRPWLEKQRRAKQTLSEDGRRGGQAPKDPASYYGNQNARKQPPQVAPVADLENPALQGRRDAQAGKATEAAKAYLAHTAENAAFSTRLQFAENLGLPAARLAFTGAEFEKFEEDLKNLALVKEALLRARIGKFSRFEDWETAKKETAQSARPLRLAPLLSNIFNGIKRDLAKQSAPAQDATQEGQGEASTQDPARPPQNSTQADKEGARNLPAENPAQEVAEPKEEPKDKKPNLWAQTSTFKRKCALALGVAESALELSQAEFAATLKEGLEGRGALRNFLRQAKLEAQTEAGEKMRKDLAKGGKLPLRFYVLRFWQYEKAYFEASPAERKALKAEREKRPFLYKAPPKKQKGKAK